MILPMLGMLTKAVLSAFLRTKSVPGTNFRRQPQDHEPKDEDNLKNIDNLNERRPKIGLQLHILTC